MEYLPTNTYIYRLYGICLAVLASVSPPQILVHEHVWRMGLIIAKEHIHHTHDLCA